ncbi:MAG TPA: RNA polymerase sigma factor [Bacteroidales bacterium]|nr:RNA polymerase sigma factor [Bacteroidales bacterium]
MTRIEFNNQVMQLSRNLYLVAYRLLKRKDEAEDAVQEVFIRLWNKVDELDRYNSLEAFAITTVKNYSIDILRRKKLMIIEDQESHKEIHDKEPSPEEAMERKESSSILNSIIERLPDLYRSVIIMKEIDGLSYEEIAGITGQNINTLRVTLSRARVMIRDEYKKYKYENAGIIRTSR